MYEPQEKTAKEVARYSAMHETWKKFSGTRHKKTDRVRFFLSRLKRHYLLAGGTIKSFPIVALAMLPLANQGKKEFKATMAEAKETYHQHPPTLSIIANQLFEGLYQDESALPWQDEQHVDQVVAELDLNQKEREVLKKYLLFGNQSQFVLSQIVRKRPKTNRE